MKENKIVSYIDDGIVHVKLEGDFTIKQLGAIIYREQARYIEEYGDLYSKDKLLSFGWTSPLNPFYND